MGYRELSRMEIVEVVRRWQMGESQRAIVVITWTKARGERQAGAGRIATARARGGSAQLDRTRRQASGAPPGLLWDGYPARSSGGPDQV
jgi:hypothetical protein